MHRSDQPKSPAYKRVIRHVLPSLLTLKGFWSRISISTYRASSIEQSSTIKSSLFEKLPPELWLNILDLLPLPSAISVAYTCQHMHASFGQKYYPELNLSQNKSKKIEFLFYLDPDLPWLRLCFSCAQFHTRKSLMVEQQDIEDCLLDNCNRKFGFFGTIGYYILDWTSIQLVMRAYNHSPEHGIPLCFLDQKWKHYGDWIHQVKPLIVDARLLIKVQSTKSVDMNTKLDDIRIYDSVLVFEPHCFLNNRLELLTCALGHIQSDSLASSCNFCARVWRCPASNTEYMVEITRSDEEETILAREGSEKPAQYNLTYTEWMNFGGGISPTSQEWKALSCCYEADLSVIAEVPSTVNIGSIRTCFERSIGNYVEDIPASVPVWRSPSRYIR